MLPGYITRTMMRTTPWRRIPGLAQVPDSSPRLPAVTGLRALAATLVFLVHYANFFAPYLDPDSFSCLVAEFLAKSGRCGTSIFFVLSGYLVYGMLLRQPVDYLSFLRRRVQRIYPAFLCVLAVYVLVSLLFPAHSRIPGRFVEAVYYLAQNVALLPGVFAIEPIVTVTWTLSYEFLWYLTLPLLVRATGLRAWPGRHRVVFFAALAFLYTTSCILAPQLETRTVLYFVGVLLHEALRCSGLQRSFTRAGEFGALLTFLAIFPVTYLLHTRGWHGVPGLGPGVLASTCRTLVVALGLSCLIGYGLGREGVLKRLLSWVPLQQIGNLSYSLYLTHGLALHGIGLILSRIVSPSGHHPWVFWAGLPITYAATLGLAALLYHGVEKRFLASRQPTAPVVSVERELPPLRVQPRPVPALAS